MFSNVILYIKFYGLMNKNQCLYIYFIAHTFFLKQLKTKLLGNNIFNDQTNKMLPLTFNVSKYKYKSILYRS